MEGAKEMVDSTVSRDVYTSNPMIRDQVMYAYREEQIQILER